VDFEWVIGRLTFFQPLEDWGRYTSSLFFDGKTHLPEWYMSLKNEGPIIEVDLHHCSEEETGCPILIKVAILNEKREKIFPDKWRLTEKTYLPCTIFQIEKSLLLESNCFVNGNLIISCEIQHFCSKYPPFQPGKSSAVAEIDGKPLSNNSHLASQLQDLFQSVKYSDITINVRGRVFPAHKMILAARSSYFAAMFDHPTNKNLTNQIEIDDIEPSVFHEILHFIYTGRPSEAAMGKMSVEILAVANKYLLGPLTKEYENRLTRQMTAENCLQLLLLTDEHHPAYHLKEWAIDFFHFYNDNVLAMEDWEKAKKDHPQTCCSILEELAEFYRSQS
jgi:speckle-type POZ protein